MATFRIRNAYRSCQSLSGPLKCVDTSKVAVAQARWITQSTCQRTSQLYNQPSRRKIAKSRLWQTSSRSQIATTTTGKPSSPATEPNLPLLQGRVNELAQSLHLNTRSSKSIPGEDVVLTVLKEYEDHAQTLLGGKDAPARAKVTADGTATSALLQAVDRSQSPSRITKTALLALISQHADAIVEAPTTFITPAILKTYISLQSHLNRPQNFPNVLSLYRTKPVPRPSKQEPYVSFTKPNPQSPAAAVAPAIADAALDAALISHDLSLALAIVDNTYCTTSYKRSKFLRSALFPIAGAVLTPLAAYTLATRFSDLQNTMDPGNATGIAMAGILTYTTTVATIGYVALTTANDQMVRVTWATGMPLWERWVREEERAAVDRIAQHWGFKSMDRWGEEEGVEWDGLREWVGLRGMVLDRVDLMEGME